MKTIEQRFWEKVGPHDDPSICWLWAAEFVSNAGRHGTAKYGRFKIAGRKVLAHRLSYEMHYHITIPEGMTIDHVKERGCTSTLCVNPYHLEMITGKETLRGANMVWDMQAGKTQCPKGHAYDEDNTGFQSGGRYCRVCAREQSRQRYWGTKNE